MKSLWNKLVKLWKWLWKQLKDWRNLVIFAIVSLVVSCEVWVPYLLGFLTGNTYWFTIGSACWAFWLAPFTPFIVICITVTLTVRKIIDRIRSKHREK